MAPEQNTHRNLTPANLFAPANAEHLAAIRKAFPTFDMKAIQQGVEQGDEDAIGCAERMIGFRKQTIESSAIIRLHTTVQKEQGEDEDGRFVEVWAPLPGTDPEFSGRLGKRVYASGNEADDTRRVRLAALTVVHTLRARELGEAFVRAEGGVV